MFKTIAFGMALALSSCTGLSPALAQVVKVSTKLGSGTGFYIGNGKVVTAAHVVEGSVDGGKKEVINGPGTYLATVSLYSKEDDVAVLEIATIEPEMKALKFVCLTPEVGTDIKIEGHPFGLPVKQTAWGKVSSGEFKFQDWNHVYVTNSGAAPGNSGSPVSTMDGSVVGMLVGGFPVGNYNFVVPSSTICKLLGIN